MIEVNDIEFKKTLPLLQTSYEVKNKSVNERFTTFQFCSVSATNLIIMEDRKEGGMNVLIPNRNYIGEVDKFTKKYKGKNSGDTFLVDCTTGVTIYNFTTGKFNDTKALWSEIPGESYIQLARARIEGIKDAVPVRISGKPAVMMAYYVTNTRRLIQANNKKLTADACKIFLYYVTNRTFPDFTDLDSVDLSYYALPGAREKRLELSDQLAYKISEVFTLDKEEEERNSKKEIIIVENGGKEENNIVTLSQLISDGVTNHKDKVVALDTILINKEFTGMIKEITVSKNMGILIIILKRWIPREEATSYETIIKNTHRIESNIYPVNKDASNVIS